MSQTLTRSVAALVVGCTLTACSGRAVDDSTEETSESSGSATSSPADSSTSAAGTSTGATTGEVGTGSSDGILGCAEVCDARPDESGWCPFNDGSGWDTNCTAWCVEQAARWTMADWGAFQSCVWEDPLCFQTVESCMCHRLEQTDCPP